MLDTVTIIPIILAYTFIGLLFTILSFIAIYISHKVYSAIFDKMPLDSIVANMPNQKIGKTSEEKEYLKQQQEHNVLGKFDEKYTSKSLQLMDVKRESRKVA